MNCPGGMEISEIQWEESRCLFEALARTKNRMNVCLSVEYHHNYLIQSMDRSIDLVKGSFRGRSLIHVRIAVRSTLLLRIILAGQILQRSPIRFRHHESAEQSRGIDTRQEQKRVFQSYASGVPVILVPFPRILRRVQESERAHNRTRFPCSSGDSMASGPQPGREKLSRDDEGRDIGSEVGEEECERVECQKRRVVAAAEGPWVAWTGVAAELVVLECEHEHEERHEEEADHLNDPSPDHIYECHCHPVPWHC